MFSQLCLVNLLGQIAKWRLLCYDILVTKNTAIKYIAEVVAELPEKGRRDLIDFAEYLRYREISQQGLTSEIAEGIKNVKQGKYRHAKEFFDEI